MGEGAEFGRPRGLDLREITLSAFSSITLAKSVNRCVVSGSKAWRNNRRTCWRPFRIDAEYGGLSVPPLLSRIEQGSSIVRGK